MIKYSKEPHACAERHFLNKAIKQAKYKSNPRTGNKWGKKKVYTYSYIFVFTVQNNLIIK